MVADDPESFADLDGHCDPGLDCLQANLKSAANKVAEGYEKAADAIVTVAKDTVNTAGAGVGELVAGVASGDSGKINEGMGKLVLVALPFIADAPEARVQESITEGAAEKGEAGAASPASQLQINKAAGDAFRDEVADSLKQSGRDVQKEVIKSTPFGPRRVDIEVKHNGKTLGGVETKTGNSPYKPRQRAKDNYLKQQGYPVNVVRKPKPPKP